MTSVDLVALLPWIALGTAGGIIAGAVPGLTGAMVIALVVPLTFPMHEASALALLVSLYTGAVSGGLVSAALLNIPGTPAAMITALDAHPMTLQGRAGRALGLAVGASFCGGMLSGVALLLLAAPIARWSVHLGPFDLFALVALAMVFIAAVAEPGAGGVARGVIAGMAGCLLALPGMNPASGELRYTFGFEAMSDGFRLLPVLIGLFAFGQALADLASPPPGAKAGSGAAAEASGVLRALRDLRGHAVNVLRSSGIGTMIGILPGIGANIGSTIAYGVARALSRSPEKFGRGSEEGLVASESANNATVGGALIPLVSLGIPGSVVDAILIGAFIVHGLQPGPLLFANHPETVHSLIAAYLVSNVVMALLMLASIRWIARLAKAPRVRLAPLILVFCAVGCYTLGNRMFDVWVMAGFGLLGLAMKGMRLPAAPFVIGFVLAPLAEENLASGLMASGGSYLPLATRPFALVCLLAAAALLTLNLLRRKGLRGLRGRNSADPS